LVRRIGIDVGGTFTDFVMIEQASGAFHYHKEPSIPADPSEAVGRGLGRLLTLAQAAPDEVDLIVHGTTISLNSILQRRGARVALVVSAGNRDLLEIARVHMADSYGFFAQPEAPLVPRDRVIEAPVRIMADGALARTASDADVAMLSARLAAMEVEAVAVVLLNAPTNPAAEADLAARLRRHLAVPVTASTAIWSEVREYERAMVAVMNAYISPILHAYYTRLETHVAGNGITAPVSITTSNGGSVDIATAYDRPIDSTLSGPASGVVAAIHTARASGFPNIVTFDMGGTSADIALAQGDAPDITTRAHLGEIPLILPIVNVSAIGAGGGSILRADAGGLLKVGPTSAGARPGPACYGLGGADPTMTDCYLACGYLDADNFAGGMMRVDPALSHAALEKVGRDVFGDAPDLAIRTADAALRVASSMMATEVRKTLARCGADPADFVLLPYGGAGPVHAALLAEEAGLDRILLAARPGVFCALGAAVANLRRDFVESCRITSDRGDAAGDLAQILTRLREQGAEWQAKVDQRVSDWRFEAVADVRYPEQAFELPLRLTDMGDDLLARFAEAFHHDHERLYGFADRSSPVEIGRLVLSIIGTLPGAEIRFDCAPQSVARRRPVYVHGAWHEAVVVDRQAILADAPLLGPAIIEQSDTTTLVPPGWQVARLADGSLLMECKRQDHQVSESQQS
jgi:N-methylhydantoinase A